MPENFRTRERVRARLSGATHHEAWQQSALNQREYCEAHGIPLKALGNWRAKFKAEPQLPAPKFLYRRRGLSHTLGHRLSHGLSNMTNDGILTQAAQVSAQIPACAADAPGLLPRVKRRAMNDLVSLVVPLFGSTRYFGSVSEPRPPNGCSPWVRPFPPQLPPGVASPCSVASQVPHPRTCSACGLSPSRTGPAHESGHG